MAIRTRITIAFLAVFVSCFVAQYLVEREMVYGEFKKLEVQAAERNRNRWVQAVEREIEHLAAFAGDWTEWDDAYDFVTVGDPEFIDANLSSESWFTKFDVPVLSFYDASGSVVWSRWVDPESGEPLVLPELRRALAPGSGPLVASDDHPVVGGLLATSAGPLLVVSRVIHRTDGSGPPAGFALFARLAGHRLVEALSRQALSQGTVTTLGQLVASDDQRDELRGLASGVPLQIRSGETLSSYVAVRDVFGEPTIAVRSDTPAVISAQGRLALWLSVLSLGATGLVAMFVQLLVVNRVVVRPLARLVEHARDVKSTGDLTTRFASHSSDEIGQLAGEFDGMVRRLAGSHAELVMRSRVLGKAEIASSVTHNLGNVLNSAVVSLESLEQTLARIRAEGCAKAADLLQGAQGAQPAGDPRVAQLPRYLRSLAESLEADRARLREDSARVRDQLRHMGEILEAQRDVARQGAYSEVVELESLAERAIAMMAPSFERHNVTVERDFRPVASLCSDPVQIVQILVNILTNAKEAMASTPEGDRRVRVSIAGHGDHARLTIEDTGCGISSEDIDALFRAGYTTKRAGSGVGLHFCALAAQQLGGRLAAASDGRGRGAAFTLELPVRAAAGRAAA